MSEKEVAISHLKDEIQKLSHENITLSSQIENSQKLMDKNYISTVLKQLVESQEKNVFYQSQFSEVIN